MSWTMKSVRVACAGLLAWCCLAGSALAGERIAILMDPGSTDRGTRQIGERMERDLKNVLDKRGHYSSRIIKSRDEFKQDSGEYLMNVRIVRYNSGSKAARIIVGFGAGSCSLDIHYEFIGPKGNTLISKDDGVGSSLDWQRLARKLNENILESVQARFKAGNLDADVAPAKPAAAAAPAQVVPAAPVQQAVQVAPPVQPAVTVAAPAQDTAPGDPVEQLRKLDAMKKQRLISEGEYRQKRKQILDRL